MFDNNTRAASPRMRGMLRGAGRERIRCIAASLRLHLILRSSARVSPFIVGTPLSATEDAGPVMILQPKRPAPRVAHLWWPEVTLARSSSRLLLVAEPYFRISLPPLKFPPGHQMPPESSKRGHEESSATPQSSSFVSPHDIVCAGGGTRRRTLTDSFKRR